MKEVAIIGIDLAKRVFQAHGAAADGRPCSARGFRAARSSPFSRGQVLTFLARQPACTVAMEACATAHRWGREIERLGHVVRLIPPIHVKPFVKRQKMGGLPPSPGGIASCQGRGVQRHEEERTADEG
jgi:transposase